MFMSAKRVQNSAGSANTPRTSARSSESASSAIFRSGRPSGNGCRRSRPPERGARACVEPPERGPQVAHDRFDGDEPPIAQVDRVAYLHVPQPVRMLRVGEMVVAHVAVDRHLGIGFEQPPQPARVGGFLVGEEQVFQLGAVFRQNFAQLAGNDGVIPLVARFDEHGAFRTDEKKGRIVAVVNLSLVVLFVADAEPETPGAISRGRGFSCGFIFTFPCRGECSAD